MIDNLENNDSVHPKIILIHFQDEDFVFEGNTEGVLSLVQKVSVKYGDSAKEELTEFLRSHYAQWSASGYKMDVGKIEQALLTFDEPSSTRFGMKDLVTKQVRKSPNILLIIIGVLAVSLIVSLFFLFSFRAQALERAMFFADAAATTQESITDDYYVDFAFTGDEISIESKNVQMDYDCSTYRSSSTRSRCREVVDDYETQHFLYSYTPTLTLMKKLELPERVIQLINSTSALDGIQTETVNDTKAGTIVVSWKYRSGYGLVFVVSRQCPSTCYKVDLPAAGSSTSETQSLG
jgi:hypothetical protein